MIRILGQTIRSDALVRFGPLMIVLAFLQLIIAMLFWVDASLGGLGFQPETWGEFAYKYPAKMWAAFMMAGGTLISTGLMYPPKNWMVLTGSAFMLIEYIGTGYSAIFTGGEFVIGVFAWLFFVPYYLWLSYEAIRHGKLSSDV